MRHKKDYKKLGRSSAHVKATISSLVCNLIEQKRVKTTLSKAKLAGRMAEKMVTLGRKGDLAARRLVISRLSTRPSVVPVLFNEIVPSMDGRKGGYTRVVKLGKRISDSSEMAVLEWVGVAVPDKRKKKKEEKTVQE